MRSARGRAPASDGDLEQRVRRLEAEHGRQHQALSDDLSVRTAETPLAPSRTRRAAPLRAPMG